MFALRPILFLGVIWLIVMSVGIVMAILMPLNILRVMLAFSDNWLLRPLYHFVGWIVEARRIPNRED